MIFDTSVLIQLERETRRRIEGKVSQFVGGLNDTRLLITPTIAGELSCGVSMAEKDVWEAFLKPFDILPITSKTAWLYGVNYRTLASRGLMIGTNDLWIAACALENQTAIATCNVNEFRRIPNLEIVEVR